MAYPTEEEFQYQRRVIRERWRHLFAAVEEQLRYVDEVLGEATKGYETKYDLALSALLARATKTAVGLVLLCEYGFGEMAMGALRSLGEAMASAYYMSLAPEARADRFEAFTRWERLQAFELMEFLAGPNGLGDVPAQFRDPQWVAALKAEFPNPARGWTQAATNQVIAAIEPCWGDDELERRQLREVARVLHLFGDRHSHIGPYDTIDLVRVGEEGAVVLHLGPGKKWVPQALVTAAWVYGQIFDLWAEHFQIPDIESWRRRWKLLFARTRALDAAAVAGVGRNDPCPCGSGFKFKRCHADLVA